MIPVFFFFFSQIEASVGDGSYFNLGGTAVSDTGVMQTRFLDDSTSPPPASVFIEGYAHAQTGERYVALWPGSGGVFYRDGVARRGDGAMCIVTSGTPRDFVSGVGLSSRGEVLVSTAAPQVSLKYGMRMNGYLCVSEAA